MRHDELIVSPPGFLQEQAEQLKNHTYTLTHFIFELQQHCTIRPWAESSLILLVAVPHRQTVTYRNSPLWVTEPGHECGADAHRLPGSQRSVGGGYCVTIKQSTPKKKDPDLTTPLSHTVMSLPTGWGHCTTTQCSTFPPRRSNTYQQLKSLDNSCM